jgi:hypothetical protein
MYKLVFFVPETHLEKVKTAVFNAGAGRIGNYDQCCWQIAGLGQFRPLAGSNAYLGELGQLEQVPEYRVEMVCEEAQIKPAIAALRLAHPYEEPAIDAWRLADVAL